MIKHTVAAVAGLAMLAATSLAFAGKAKDDEVWPAEAIKWEDGPVKGTHVAKLWGEWMKGGPYGVLVKFDGGVMHELHHHSHDLRTVIVSGTFVFQPEGGKETRLGPGSFLRQVGGKKHVSGCASGAECVFVITSSDKFDYLDDSGADAKGKKTDAEGKK